MANLTIPSIRARLFNSSKHEEVKSSNDKASNPFQQTSFKGNVLTADVFESSKSKDNQPSFIGRLASVPAKSKLYLSAMVGSINNFGNKISEKFHAGVESINEFCKKASDKFSNLWSTMKNTEIKFDFLDNIKNAMNPGVRKNDIGKLDLSNDDIYNSTKELFSSKANAWAESIA